MLSLIGHITCLSGVRGIIYTWIQIKDRTPNNTRVKEILGFVLKLWIQKSTLQYHRPT